LAAVPELDDPELHSAELDATLHELAEAFGIATEYWDWQGRHISVSRDTIISVLAALEVDATTPEAAAAALEDRHRQPWTQMLPPCLVIRERRTASVWVHVPHGDLVTVWIELETGGTRNELRQLENWTPPRQVDDIRVGEASFEIPDDLPLGYHTLKACQWCSSSVDALDHYAAVGRLSGTDGAASWLGFRDPALQRPFPAVLGASVT
jgi:4-alpha-glucanotransferase